MNKLYYRDESKRERERERERKRERERERESMREREERVDYEAMVFFSEIYCYRHFIELDRSNKCM